MESINNSIHQINNLPKMKKLILIVMVIIIIFFIFDLIISYNRQKFRNTENSSKNLSKIENLDTAVEPTNTEKIVIGDLELDPKKTNISLYYADWCGHCKQFKASTWGQITEKYANSESIKINDVDCTNVKAEIKTAAGKTIQGFPTVIINYKNADGEYIEEEYSGGRSYEVFNAYVEKFNSK